MNIPLVIAFVRKYCAWNLIYAKKSHVETYKGLLFDSSPTHQFIVHTRLRKLNSSFNYAFLYTTILPYYIR